MSEIARPAADEPAIDAEALKKAEQFIEAEEGASNKLPGTLGIFVSVTAVVMSLFHLYSAYAIVPTQVLRPVHVGFVLFLSYLLFPASKRYRHRIMWWDWLAALGAVAVIAYILQGGDDIWDRNTSPDNWDIVFGVALILLILEGMRRASGWVMPLVVASFVVYALFGEQLPGSWAHRSYEVGRLVGHLFITLEGIFGVAVDVSSSLIILFTIYGAFLQHSGASKFFIDFSLALMGGKPNSAGRTVVLSSFLIAEFLKISYLDVIWMATIPTCLYYLSLLFMVELDAKRFGAAAVPYDTSMTLWQMTKRYGFHFTSLIAVIVFMVVGYSPMLAVFYSTFMCFMLSGLAPETALGPRKLLMALGAVTVVGLLLLAIPGLRSSAVAGLFTTYFPPYLLILLAALAIYGMIPSQRTVPSSQRIVRSLA